MRVSAAYHLLGSANSVWFSTQSMLRTRRDGPHSVRSGSSRLRVEEHSRETRDISIGGVFVDGISVAFGVSVTVRWVSSGGVGVQFGLIGARETHLLTDIVAVRDIA